MSGAWIWEAQSGRETDRFPTPPAGDIAGLAFSPDCSTLAAGSTSGLRLWDLKSNLIRRELAHPDGVFCVAFAPDGKTVATGDCNGVTRIWDSGTGARVHVLARSIKRDEERPGIYSVAFTHDGKTVAAAGDDHFVTLWDVATGQERRRLVGHLGRVRSIAISPDGETLASGSDDGTALLWDLSRDERAPRAK